MTQPQFRPGLILQLPRVRGAYAENVDLGKMTWFRTGGSAEIMFKPKDRDDLSLFLSARPVDVPLTVIGVGSNLLVRDGGVPGVVIRLGREFAEIAVEENEMRVGAGALDLSVALTAQEKGKTGLEFLSGIPGLIGGALRMNAGAFGSEMKDVVINAVALDGAGEIKELSLDDLGFSYRSSAVPEDWIFVSTRLHVRPGDKKEIVRRMNEIQAARQANQPFRRATAGSTFANPPGAKAWELIERAGCRGLSKGGAKVSEKHCNFLLNTGTATAADIEGLGEEIRKRVAEETGVVLKWEIRRLGIPANENGLKEVAAEGDAS